MERGGDRLAGRAVGVGGGGDGPPPEPAADATGEAAVSEWTQMGDDYPRISEDTVTVRASFVDCPPFDWARLIERAAAMNPHAAVLPGPDGTFSFTITVA